MAKKVLRCRDVGIEDASWIRRWKRRFTLRYPCDFQVHEENEDHMLESFSDHTCTEHKVDLSDNRRAEARSFILPKHEITQTAPKESTNITDRYSDISMSNHFNAYINLINSERQTIWTRYQSMLIANSIIMTLVAQRAPKLHEIEHAIEFPFIIEEFGLPMFGLLLCGLWLKLTTSAWRIFRMWQDEAARFVWIDVSVSHPIEIARTYRGPRGRGVLYVTACFVILIFMLAYVVLLILPLYHWSTYSPPFIW